MNRGYFDIEFVNLTTGTHRFSYIVTPAFFKEIGDSLIEECNGNVDLVIEKINDHLFELEFEINGVMNLECGRCLNKFDYPFQNNYRMELQVSDKKDSDDENLIIAGMDEKKINVCDIIYEFFCLQLPIKATCDMAGLECNGEMLKAIGNYMKNPSKIESEVDPRWEALKNLSKS